jgi:hypothetical protein
MSNSNRLVDARNTVTTHLDKAKGIRTQADTDAQLRDLERYSTSEALFAAVTNDPTFEGTVSVLGGAVFDDLITAANIDITKWSCGCHHVPGGTTLEVQGMQAWTAGGAITSGDSPFGSYAIYDTAAVIGDAQGPNGSARFRRDQNVDALFMVRTGNDITSQRVWVGLFESDPSGSSTITTQNYIGFRYLAGTDTNWRLETGDGAAHTVQDSGISVDFFTGYLFLIRATSTQVTFSVGVQQSGVSMPTKVFTTNLPTSSLLLSPFVRITALAASSRSLAFSKFNAMAG